MFKYIERESYKTQIIPKITSLKLKYWNHEGINLHSRDIRKAVGNFKFLLVPENRIKFISELSDFIKTIPFTVFITCINKPNFISKFGKKVENPYEIALRLSMKFITQFLEHKHENELPLIAESRGKREDAELREAFFEIIAYGTDSIEAEKIKNLKFPLEFWDKKANITGLQLSDLAAYPYARHILKPDQSNQSFEIIKDKIFKNEQINGFIIYP
jgi:hypothetical protein